MITAQIDTKTIARQIKRISADFGDANETAIARWGVATCRSMVGSTRAWAKDGKSSLKIQREAIAKDVNRAVFSVSKPTLNKIVDTGKLKGLMIKGTLVTFTPDRVLRTPEEVVNFIDLNRKGSKKRIPTMKYNTKGIAKSADVKKAIVIKDKQSGKAKGGWIGAGKAIGAKQRKGSRITIGKGVAGYAHKFSSGGTAQLIRSVWNPIGKLINKVPYVDTDYVLKKSDAQEAINQGGRMTIKWYQSAMAARLKRKNK